MDVKGNNVTPDFSSYILFEASGDSEEADFDHNNMVCEISRVGSYVHHGHGHEDYDDDDDAMSCSYDRSDYDDDACNVAEANWDDDDDDDDDDGKKKEEDVVFGTSYCDEEDEVLQEQHPTRSFVSFASNQESLDEMEKNRLFWEACLAS